MGGASVAERAVSCIGRGAYVPETLPSGDGPTAEPLPNVLVLSAGRASIIGVTAPPSGRSAGIGIGTPFDADSERVGDSATADYERELGLPKQGAHIDFLDIAVEEMGPRQAGLGALRPSRRLHLGVATEQGRAHPNRP